MALAYGLTAGNDGPERVAGNSPCPCPSNDERTIDPGNATIAHEPFVLFSTLFSGEQEHQALIKFIRSSGLALEPVTEDIF